MKIPHEELILEFIERSLPFLRDRPIRFQHDDFHVGNIIVKDGAFAATIDFNRYDWGDPIHDFLKIGFFSRTTSVPFCIGQIHGYFGQDRVPNDFWNLYACYVAMTMIGTVAWTLKVVPEQIVSEIERIERVLEDHQYFKYAKPSWYPD